MTRSTDAIMAELTPLFREFFMDDGIQLSPDTTAADLIGWDSLTNISLMIAIQTHYGIKLTSREQETLKNVGDLAASVAGKLIARTQATT